MRVVATRAVPVNTTLRKERHDCVFRPGIAKSVSRARRRPGACRDERHVGLRDCRRGALAPAPAAAAANAGRGPDRRLLRLDGRREDHPDPPGRQQGHRSAARRRLVLRDRRHGRGKGPRAADPGHAREPSGRAKGRAAPRRVGRDGHVHLAADRAGRISQEARRHSSCLAADRRQG